MTLYRKYRPQNFHDVVGQNHIKLTLEHEIRSGKIAHAYLFCGPRAVGKTTLSRVFAKSINCTNRKEDKFEPCDECDSCKDIMLGRNMDIIEIDAASHTGVDNVRENIISSARVAPVKSKYKVFIIDEAHMLSTAAFNALLKIMEEPPAFVVFILCTTEIHKVPTTIISRCQRFDFKKINLSDVVKKLNYIIETEGIKVSQTVLEAVAKQSEGHMRDAESLLGQIVAVSGKEISDEEAMLVIPRNDLDEAVNLIEFLFKKDAKNAVRLVNKMVDEGIDLKVFTGDLIEIIRKIILIKLNPGLGENFGLNLGEGLELKISELGKDVEMGSLAFWTERFLKARNELKNTNIVQLPLELAIIEICFGVSTVSQRTVAVPSQGNKAINAQIEIRPENEAGEPEKEKTPVTPIDLNQVKREDIISRWNEVLAKVKKENHSLSFILKVCEPRSINGNQLCLAFKYKFHKDRVNDPNIRVLIEKVLRDVYGVSLILEALIDENLDFGNNVNDTFMSGEPQASQGANQAASADAGNGEGAIDDLLKSFGGKVVG